MRYIERLCADRLHVLLRSFPAVLLVGPRQCMKDLGLSRGWVITTARERQRLSAGIEIIPWDDVAEGQIELF